jgi:HSP20 family protein
MSTLNLWQDPFADVEQLVRTVFGTTPDRPQGWTPASEVFRDNDDAVVRVELPGLDPANDIAVEMDRNYLVIRGERRDERSESDERSRGSIREMRYGSFRRVFRLPEHVSSEDLAASYDAGVLTVRVLRAYAPPRPVQVAIGVGSPAAVSVEASSQPTDATASSAPAGSHVAA